MKVLSVHKDYSFLNEILLKQEPKAFIHEKFKYMIFDIDNYPNLVTEALKSNMQIYNYNDIPPNAYVIPRMSFFSTSIKYLPCLLKIFYCCTPCTKVSKIQQYKDQFIIDSFYRCNFFLNNVNGKLSTPALNDIDINPNIQHPVFLGHNGIYYKLSITLPEASITSFTLNKYICQIIDTYYLKPLYEGNILLPKGDTRDNVYFPCLRVPSIPRKLLKFYSRSVISSATIPNEGYKNSNIHIQYSKNAQTLIIPVTLKAEERFISNSKDLLLHTERRLGKTLELRHIDRDL